MAKQSIFVGGFDLHLGHLTLVEGDWNRALSRLRILRRRALREQARVSASKCLVAMLSFGSPSYRLRAARRLAQEVRTVETIERLGAAEGSSGHARRAHDLFGEMRALALKIGDLDGVHRAEVRAQGLGSRAGSHKTTYRSRISLLIQQAKADPQRSFVALQRLRVAFERRAARHSALECQQALVVASAYASDARSGAHFAQQLVGADPSGWSYIALGLFEEHLQHRSDAAFAYRAAVQLARWWGDLHHLQQACVGLARIESLDLLRDLPGRQIAQKALAAYPLRPPLTHIKQLLGLYWSDMYSGLAPPTSTRTHGVQ
jgi:hypothetical protein